MQRLIQPINKMVISASFQNSNYATKFGYNHWGVDMYGENKAYCQGNGFVLAKGVDNTYGKYVVILYPDVEKYGSLVASYFHLNDYGSKIVKGNPVTKDTILGVPGDTGNAAGVHLHVEMRPYNGDIPVMISAFSTQRFTKNDKAGWFNPLQCMYRKSTNPDFQTRTFSDTIYTNSEDRNMSYGKLVI